MLRVVTTLVVFVATLGVIGSLVVVRTQQPAIRAGGVLYSHREVLRQIEGTARRRAPAVVWLGDSSIMDTPTVRSYPALIDDEDLRPMGLHAAVFAAMGFDFYAYYCLLDRALDLGPQLLVMIANFRVSKPEGGVRGFNDLAAVLPWARLPATLGLPYNFRGMTAPRLLLAHLLDSDGGEASFLFLEGIRRAFQERPFWEALGPSLPKKRTVWEAFVEGRDSVLADYRRPIRPQTPLMRFAGAAVAHAVSRGVKVLVVITPVPVDRLTAKGWFDPAEYASRVAAVREVVESRGGHVLDLHAALPDSLFRDAGGHFTLAGSARMADLVWPSVAVLLPR